MKIREVVTLFSGQIRQFLTIYFFVSTPPTHTHTHTQDGTPTTRTFEHTPSEIGAEEAEEVGVEHLLR